MTTINRKQQILEIIEHNTQKAITLNDFSNIGLDASTISNKIFIERSNISRILNTLNKESLLIKTKNKPTLYFAYRPLKEFSNNKILPIVVANKEELINILNNKELYDLNNHVYINFIIGTKSNESLSKSVQRIKSSIYYPNGGLNILIEGPSDTGKGSIAKNISLQYAQFNKIKQSEIFRINCYSYSSNSLIDHILKNKELRLAKIIILLNIDEVFNNNFDFFRATIVNYFSKYKINPYIIGTYNGLLDKKRYASSHTFFPTIIQSTSIKDKTCKEKFEYVLKFMQREADNINAKIIISKDVLTYFVLSHYEYNLLNLKNEIKQSISQSYYRTITNYPYLNEIVIDHSDLSDYLLNNYLNDSSVFSELNSIYDYLELNTFTFTPKINNEVFNKIHSMSLTPKKRLSINFSYNETISLDDYVNNEMTRLKANLISNINLIDDYKMRDLIKKFIIIQVKEAKDEILVDYLALHLNNLISSLKNNTYIEKYSMNNHLDISKKYIDIASNIYDYITNQFDLNIPIIEKYYIAVYLKDAFEILSSCTHIFIICHGENIAEYYANYAYNISNKNITHYMNYNTHFQNKDFNIFLNAVYNNISKINNVNEIIFMVDMPPLTSVAFKVEKETGIKSFTIQHISLPLVIDTITKIKDNNYNLDDFKTHLREEVLFNSDFDILLSNIQNKFLRESLTFLDPIKASNTLYDKLKKIALELSIELSEQLIIKFVIHSSYAIERAIKHEKYTINNNQLYTDKYTHIFFTIKKHFKDINETFGCEIDDDELRIIATIFENY